MSELEFPIPIPTIEEIIDDDAYEARMHFLIPNEKFRYGKYVYLPGKVSEPTAQAAQAELPFSNHPGVLLWVDFSQPELTNISEGPKGKKYHTVSRAIGERAVHNLPGILQPYNEVLTHGPTDFKKLWLACYAMDRKNDPNTGARHPLSAIYELYKQAHIQEEIWALLSRTSWDNDTIEHQTRNDYLHHLASVALKEIPELADFTIDQKNLLRLNNTPHESPLLKSVSKAVRSPFMSHNDAYDYIVEKVYQIPK